jgi:hypothetical protein
LRFALVTENCVRDELNFLGGTAKGLVAVIALTILCLATLATVAFISAHGGAISVAFTWVARIRGP